MNLLLVEDETQVADFIRRGLKAEGWFVEHAADGEAALRFLQDRDFDVVVLDLMLPGMSGHDVCQRMRARKNHTPVLMLTALDTTDERVTGLRLGADDYLPKPFDFDELIARVEALHRRATAFTDAQAANASTLCYQGLAFDRDTLELSVDGSAVSLSAKERELIVLLLSNVNRVLSRERILNAVWGSQQDPLTNVVDVYVGRLRRKIRPYDRLITTVRGAGYKLG